MAISRQEFEKGMLENQEIVYLKKAILVFLKAHNDRAFTSGEIQKEIKKDQAFFKKINPFSSGIRHALTSLVEDGSILCKTIDGTRYFCIRE